MQQETDSPVITYLQSTYRMACSSGGHSWQVINRAMQRALSLAIEARFPFREDDFETLCRHLPGHWPNNGFLGWTRWMSEGGEPFYRLAIESRNLSAAIAFERWKKRKPYIFRGKRLYEGARFEWEPGEWWYCNSFDTEGQHINCGRYQSDENPMGWKNNTSAGEGPTQKMRLTVADIKAQEKRLKATAT